MLVVDSKKDVISRSLQLIASRTAQEYNIRKNRKGAFWEDRYHATAVQTDKHLAKCLIYIDLNMVRAGVVKHPSEYGFSGYNEIQAPPKRYSIINRKILSKLLGIQDEALLQQAHLDWVEMELKNNSTRRDILWSESVAVGTESFVKDIHQQLDKRVKGRSIISHNGSLILKEPETAYSTLFDAKKSTLRHNNIYVFPVKYGNPML
ncbi:MAG: transposase [Desulfobulbaceae bacterium]|nr:transposase [Desulfobulbaceae bacterium]